MSSSINFKGPTSSQKKRKGGKYRGGNKTINIFDFDTETCNTGVVEGIINGNSVSVKDLKTNKLVHCTTHRMNTRKCPRGSLVVFSYIYRNTTGEILNIFNTDDLVELCEHFGIGQEKASKAIGINIAFGTNEIDDTEYIPIAKQSVKPIIDNLVQSSLHGMDSILDIESEESDIEPDVKYDRFGNTIEESVDIIVDLVEQNNQDTINVIPEDYENSQEDEKSVVDNDPSNKFRKNKKDLKNTRSNARNKKHGFIEY